MYGSANVNHLARVLPNGQLDTTFHIGSGADNDVYCFFPQEDGKILIGGIFVLYNGVEVGGIARLNEDGSLDPTFQNQLIAGGPVWTIEQQPDGKYLLGGDFYTYGGSLSRNIVRLNNDGSIDNSFTSKTPNNWVRAIEVQQDGKIIIGGDFTEYNGMTVNHIVRIHPNGTYDSTFKSGSGFDDLVRDMEQLPDGRIYITGGFNTYNNYDRNDIVRIFPDGSIDPNFDVGQGPKGWILTASIRPDGKIFVGGDFTQFGAKDIFRLACIDENGYLDLDFDSGIGPNNTVRNVHALPDGKVLITGNFTEYNTQATKRICRVNAATLNSVIEPTNLTEYVQLTPNPVGPEQLVSFKVPGTLSIQISDESGRKLKIIQFTGDSERQINVSDLPSGVYYIEFSQGQRRSVSKLIKN